MKNAEKKYEFQKLNHVLYADRYNHKRRTRLWMWFDKKTGYKLLPKVVLAMFVVTLALLGLLLMLIRYNIGTVFSVDLGVALIVLGLLATGEGIILLRIFGEMFRIHYDDEAANPLLNPGFHHLKGNIFHRHTDR